MATSTETYLPSSVLVRSYVSGLRAAHSSLGSEVHSLIALVAGRSDGIDEDQLARLRGLLEEIKITSSSFSVFIEELLGRRARRAVLDEDDY